MKKYLLLLISLLITLVACGQPYYSKGLVSGDDIRITRGGSFILNDSVVEYMYPGIIPNTFWVEDYVNENAGGASPVGVLGDFQLNNGSGGLINSEGLVADRQFNWDGNYLNIGNYNDAGTNYLYYSPQDGEFDMYYENGSSYWELWMSTGSFDMNAYNSSGYGGYIGLQTGNNPEFTMSTSSPLGDRSMMYDTTGIYLVGHSSVNWTDDYLITKGYADDNYGGGSAAGLTGDIQINDKGVFSTMQDIQTGSIFRHSGTITTLGNPSYTRLTVDVDQNYGQYQAFSVHADGDNSTTFLYGDSWNIAGTYSSGIAGGASISGGGNDGRITMNTSKSGDLAIVYLDTAGLYAYEEPLYWTDEHYITKGYADANYAGGGGAPSFGTDNQIPIMNSAGTDFEYNANFTYNGTNLDVSNDGSTSIYIGKNAGAVSSLNSNTVVGYNAFDANNLGGNNTVFGHEAMTLSTSGNSNIAIGVWAMANSTTSGSQNVAIGQQALRSSTGNYNVGIGHQAFNNKTSGLENVAVGGLTMVQNTTGSYNTALGHAAGYYNTGSSNVFIGYNAALNETGSNLLYISNSSDATPLIHGDFAADTATVNGDLNVTGTLSENNVPVSNLEHYSGSLTDGAPTDAELDGILGTPATNGAGYKATIKDSDGTGLVYSVVSDGTNWYYFTGTQAL